jgi:hypothetical protein
MLIHWVRTNADFHEHLNRPTVLQLGLNRHTWRPIAPKRLLGLANAALDQDAYCPAGNEVDLPLRHTLVAIGAEWTPLRAS